MFDHEIPSVVRAMRDLTVGVFEHLEITSDIDFDKKVMNMQRILIGTTLKK